MPEPTAPHGADTQPADADGGRGWEAIVTLAPGVSVSHVEIAGLASVLARSGRSDELAARVGQGLGAELPRAPRFTRGQGLYLAWAGRDHWHVRSETDDGAGLEERLRRELGSLAAVSDQSDSRLLFRIAGAQARAFLGKKVPIDLDALAFGPGDVAATLFGYVGVHIWMLDDAPTFDLLVPRSSACSFWRALTHGGWGTAPAHAD